MRSARAPRSPAPIAAPPRSGSQGSIRPRFERKTPSIGFHAARAPGKSLHQHVPEQQLQQQRNVAQHLDVNRGEPGQQPVRRQPRDADHGSEHGRKHDADDRDAQRVDDARPGRRADRYPSDYRAARYRRSASPPRGRGRQIRSRSGAPTDCEWRSTRARRRRRPRAPTTSTCQISPLTFSSRSERRIRLRGRSIGRGCRHSTRFLRRDLGLGAFDARVSYVALKRKICNICFMAEQPSKASPLNELCSALPSLPMRLQEVGRFVAANDYDATTRSMRDLAAAAGADPASFTRLAQGARLFRLGRTARRADRGAPARAIRAVFGPRPGPAPRSQFRRRADLGQARRPRPPALPASRPNAVAGAAKALARGAADLDRRLSKLPRRRGVAQLRASTVPAG